MPSAHRFHRNKFGELSIFYSDLIPLKSLELHLNLIFCSVQRKDQTVMRCVIHFSEYKGILVITAFSSPLRIRKNDCEGWELSEAPRLSSLFNDDGDLLRNSVLRRWVLFTFFVATKRLRNSWVLLLVRVRRAGTLFPVPNGQVSPINPCFSWISSKI